MSDSPTAKNATASVIIAGGGPAGLTAAYELATRSAIKPRLFEATDMLGGISRTIVHNGNRIDIGGHRFFSKSERVNIMWAEIMPVQTASSMDEPDFSGEEPQAYDYEPEVCDEVMLRRRRVSRIYYLRRFFDYPVTLSLQTLQNLGLSRTLKAGTGYIASLLHKRKEKSLEDFYINRFGKPLYRMFFEGYTEKVWGVHPSRLTAEWGSQRVKGMSLTVAFKDFISKEIMGRRNKAAVETSLIDSFLYPRLGSGQLWEAVARKAALHGAEIEMNHRVTSIKVEKGNVTEITVRGPEGRERKHRCDAFISSMPLKDLIAAMEGIRIPDSVREIAEGLPYRDFITVGLLVNKLRIKNETKLRSYGDRIPDTWIYVQERDVRLGRIQVFNNWSPCLVKDFENKIWLGLEYFCNEGDYMWEMSDDEFIAMAIAELESVGIIDAKDMEDSVLIKERKAYPAYHGTYGRLGEVRQFLDSIGNLYCVGRNGQHRYNNMDHSMLTAMEAVDAMLSGDSDKTAIWSVNSEKDYHERK